VADEEGMAEGRVPPPVHELQLFPGTVRLLSAPEGGDPLRIATVYPAGIMSAWSVADGIPRTLRRMGYEVLDLPRGRWGQPAARVADLNECDLIIVSGAEHVLAKDRFGFWDEVSREDWLTKVKAPKAAWYHESFTREDENTDFTALRPLLDFHFFPAVQDAETYCQPHFGVPDRCHYLPFGADTEIFKPNLCPQCRNGPPASDCITCLGVGTLPSGKDVDIGFIGSLYGPRLTYLDRLRPHLKGVSLLCGNVAVQDIEGPSPEETALRLAGNYRRIKVFLNLPSLSQLLVTKAVEVMACGTFLLQPALGAAAGKNMELFAHTRHLVYYRHTNLGFLAQILREFMERDLDREVIAAAGCKEVREKHSLRLRLEELLRKVGIGQ